MKSLISIAIAIGIIYALWKLGVMIMRARYISKTESNIDVLRGSISIMRAEDLEYYNEQLQNYHKPDNIINCMRTEEEVVNSLRDAQAALDYEDTVYFKFIRARERFPHNDKNIH